jgi:chitodextrinase
VETLEDRIAPATLVAAYSFNEGKGTKVADASGNGNVGTIANATWTNAGKYGKALSFNGTNARVNINDANSLDLTNAMTLEAWVRPTALSGYRSVILKERSGGLSYSLYAANSSASPSAPGTFVNVGGSDFGATTPTQLALNTWTHLAGTYDGSNLRLYINGALVSTQAVSGTMIVSGNALRIGGNSVWGEYFNGTIDEVRVYNVALTAAQIQADMNTPVGNAPPDTQPPTAPGTPTATAVSTSQINLTWTASTDNVGVSAYLVERQDPGSSSFVQIGTATGTTFNDTGRAANSTYSYRVRARDAAGNLSPYSNVASATTQAPDTTPPVVALTSPADGATVSGTVTLTANASDNIGVAGVQFLLDGANFGAEDTAAPYSLSWNTATASRSIHTLTARARDAAGNISTAVSETITVVPQLVITAPANNATVTGPTITVTYTTTGDLTGVDHAQFTLDNDPLVMDLDFDGTLSLTNVAPGTHVLNGMLVATNRSPISGTEAVPINFTVLASDTTPPSSVAITAPTDGATVTGTISLTATASDNVGVVGVQFLLDGVPLGPEDTTAPYSLSWDSTVVAGGPHTLSAHARDAAANSTDSSVITVNVVNPNDPAVVGQWSSVMNWPLVAINMVLLNNGKILMWDGGPGCIGSESARVWDPATGTFTGVPIPDPNSTTDIFCTGMSLLADGRVLIVGGHECNDPNYVGQANAYIFDPATLQWTFLPNMAYRRYYPTATTLPDGRVLVTSGSDRTVNSYDPIPEVFDPRTNTWIKLTGANQSIGNYPFMFVLPNGKVLAAGSDEQIMPTMMLDVNTQTWTVVDSRLLDGGSAVMYLPGKILKAGSSYRTPDSVDVGPSAATTYVIDTTQPSPAWQQTASMAYPRTHLNLTVLPDGNVVAIGGSTDISGFYPNNAVYPAEMWSPTTQTWTTMASTQEPRMYHSTALLLPDGRVLSAGGGRNGVTTADYLDAQIYSPPYLFKGPRPTITSAPTTLVYNSSFFIGTPDAANIVSVALIRNGSDTHANNMDQRFVPLTFTQGIGGLNVQAPADNNLAPPGYYMLFIVNKNGVPSIAPFVRLPAPYEDFQPPTAPSNLTATGAVGTAALSWGAATDDTGVIRYNVYRSTTPGFTPTAANRIAQTTTTSFTDTSLTSGTYYYRVSAQDTAGNVGVPSNEASATALTDTTPPSVTVTNPANGATVSGTITIVASATDDVGIAGVQFLLDGSSLGAEDTIAPFSVTWDTSTVPNGTHVLTARAWDTGGNTTTSTAITVTVSNAAPSGLVLALGFNEGAGTTVADASGNGNTGTIANATWTTAGKSGDALVFNGTSSMVTIPDAPSLRLTTGMTLEAWVYPTAVSNVWRDVLYKGNGAYDNYMLFSSSQPNSFPAAGGTFGSSSDVPIFGTTVLPLNTWTHLATTYDGAHVLLYVNGVQVASLAETGNILTSANPLQIGGDTFNPGGQYFQGMIDEVRVYNRALTTAQIQADMNTPLV